MDIDDVGYESSIYEIKLYDTLIEISLGKPRYEFIQYGVVYFPIYLLYNDEPCARIGIYEIEKENMLSKVDEDEDFELESDNILIYMNQPYLNRVLQKQQIMFPEKRQHSSIIDIESDSKQEIQIEPLETESETDIFRLEIPEEQKSESVKIAEETVATGIFVINKNLVIPALLNEETESESRETKKSYNESSKNNWVEKFMKNNNYSIKDNEGGGDCFFAVIRDAFEQIGQNTTVDKLRAILSKEANDDLFKQYRDLYSSFSAELQQKEGEIKTIKSSNTELKKRVERSIDKTENDKMMKTAKDLVEKYKNVISEKETTKQLMKEFEFMKNIDTLEKFRRFIQTSSYWADTWAISTLERVLNIKMIVLSEEAFENGDFDSVMNCGQLNDSDLEKQGQFRPDYYIMTCYTGNHYKLVIYKNKRILKFVEVPYDVKILIINKCLERNSGPYYLIEDIRKLKMKLNLNPNQGEPLELDEDNEIGLDRDLFDKSVEFMFHSLSDGKPHPGKGFGEKIPNSSILNFNPLTKISDWRKKLDDTWITRFEIDNHYWASVQHYYLGSQFKKGFPDFFLQFSLDSNSDISKDLKLAEIAASKSGKLKEQVLRKPNIKPDADFFEIKGEPRNVTERKTALFAKFSQNLDLKDMLLKTNPAKLLHFVRRKEPEPDILLMNLRKELSGVK
jgi:hypothetical protein